MNVVQSCCVWNKPSEASSFNKVGDRLPLPGSESSAQGGHRLHGEAVYVVGDERMAWGWRTDEDCYRL